MRYKIPLKFIILLLFLLNVFFASWYILNGDINFNSDIARDFHLLEEIDRKKLVLIGPRSSIPGVYHGPLWLYLNYPAFIIGNGNPLYVGVNWILLITVISIIYYFLTKDLFGKKIAVIYTLLSSLYFAYHAKGLFNPHGAMFLLPVFYYFLVKYVKTGQVKFLIYHAAVGGLLVQFQVAIGGPFLLLSFIYTGINAVRKKRYIHMGAYIFTLIGLSTFILFDLRHDFLISKSLLAHISRSGANPQNSMANLIFDRIKLLFSAAEFVRAGFPNINLYIFIIFIFLFIKNINRGKFRIEKMLLLYFYAGFFPISLINRYPILYFYIFPVFPLVFLGLSLLFEGKTRKILWMFLTIIYLLNIDGQINGVRSSKQYIGINQNSWKALKNVSDYVFSQNQRDFGYFVYAPDVFGYGVKYALKYSQKNHPEIQAASSVKKPVTYLIIEPPPPDNPFMKDSWWIKNQVKISEGFIREIKFPSGFKIQQYRLSAKEISVPADPNIDIGIHFR